MSITRIYKVPYGDVLSQKVGWFWSEVRINIGHEACTFGPEEHQTLLDNEVVNFEGTRLGGKE